VNRESRSIVGCVNLRVPTEHKCIFTEFTGKTQDVF
jgi:hypothetical protein